MNSFHIVCKRKKGWNMIELKVLTWQAPLKIRVRKDMNMLLRVQHKRNNNKIIRVVSFSIRLNMWRRTVPNITFGVQRKVQFLLMVCSKVNLASIPRNTWWLDSVATTHISVSMQGCLSYRKPNNGERCIFVGDRKLMEVDVIGIFRLLSATGYYLDLKDTFCCIVF